MTENTDNSTKNTIDRALDDTKDNIKKYSRNATSVLLYIFLSIFSFLGFIILAITLPNRAELSIGETGQLIFYGIFILIFGVLTSFYRYNLKETSKHERFLLALHRIRIAANNKDFSDDVIKSLTQNAFEEPAQGDSVFRRRKIESPIEGHPTSDVLTMVLNKLFERVDITPKK